MVSFPALVKCKQRGELSPGCRQIAPHVTGGAVRPGPWCLQASGLWKPRWAGSPGTVRPVQRLVQLDGCPTPQLRAQKPLRSHGRPAPRLSEQKTLLTGAAVTAGSVRCPLLPVEGMARLGGERRRVYNSGAG